MLSLPALFSQGLDTAFATYDDLPQGYYGLHHIILLYSFMALARIPNVERLKQYPPGELGKILGLDRIPEVGCLRTKLRQIYDQQKTDQWHGQLFTKWMEAIHDPFFYVDGHVRVYHGRKAQLPKHYVSRQKLCLSGTIDYWVNDQQGQPLLYVAAEVSEKLKQGVERIIPILKAELDAPEDAQKPLFTLIIDRESYEPKWYKHLWDEHQIAIITYRKNVTDKWCDSQFQHTDIQIDNNTVTMHLCEMGSQLSGHWFREVRRRADNGHQTAIITTHPTLDIQQTAIKMFARWTQENFFKYMIANFDFDKMIQYGTQPVDPTRSVVNPIYRKLSNQIKKEQEKKRRKEAKIYERMQTQPSQTIESMQEQIAKSTQLVDQISEHDTKIRQLQASRQQTPSRITVDQMDVQQRYEKLKVESKKFKNTIIMLAYRSETAMFNLMQEHYSNAKKEGRALLREIFCSDADLQPDYNNNTLTISIHSLSTPRANHALLKLCEIMTETQTIYPMTNLRMIFKTIAP